MSFGNICVVGCGRTGSTLLFSLLDQMPHVRTTRPKEFLNLRGTVPDRYSTSQFAALADFAINNTHFTLFTHVKIHSLNLQVDNRCVTFEEILTHIEAAGFSSFVHLRRRNSLRLWISIVRGWLGERHVIFNRGHLSLEQLKFASRVDPVQCIAFIEQLEYATNEIERRLLSRRHIDLVYEDHLAEDPCRALVQLKKIENFDIPSNLEITYNVTNPWQMRECIENFDQIKEALGTTKYAWMLEE